MALMFQRERRLAGSKVRRVLFAAALSLSWVACSSELPPLPADPRAVLQAHISHGIGPSPFDSPLIHDPVAAAMILAARECAPSEAVRELAGDATRGQGLLERLQSDGLMVLRDSRLCTTFPILINRRQTSYQTLTRDIAREALAALSPDLDALAAIVDERGWRDWRYHFFWSQLFDSQFVWTEMMRRELAPPLENLVAWVVHPDHPFRSGTNYYPDNELRDHWLMVTWRAGSANSVGLIGASWEILYGVALEGRRLSDGERVRLTELGLVNEDGTLNLPLLREGDPLLEHLKTTSLRYVDFLERRMPMDSLLPLSGVNRQHTFAMAYHDVSWWIVSDLVDSGRIDIPPALDPEATPDQRSLAGVAAFAPVHEPFADLIRAAIEAQR